MMAFKDDRDRLAMWVVYDHPRDQPGHFVARKFFTLPTTEPTGEAIADTDLDRMRGLFARFGLTMLFRDNNDDPVILETWL
jgi:hypothetical protein